MSSSEHKITTDPSENGLHHLPDASQLRHRKAPLSKPNHIDTIVEDENTWPQSARSSNPPPSRFSGPRRQSSFLSESSLDEARESLRASTDDFLNPRVKDWREELHEEPTLWHSLPLVFAIVPAIGGVIFQRGSALLTDFALLVLAALYLNWCLITPWVWYHSAQKIRMANAETSGEDQEDDTPLQDPETRPEASGDDNADNAGIAKEEPPEGRPSEKPKDAAIKELRLHEIYALAACFAGPLLGAYILHMIRGSITSVGHDLVTNLHLTLFVLGAEVRPMRHLMKMVQARTLHLQKVVREYPYAFPRTDASTVSALTVRLDQVEAAMANSPPSKDAVGSPGSPVAVTDDSLRKTQVALQTQIDALNRAVRRYEKRATAQTIHTDARLRELEFRLKDALSLAAAAVSHSQKDGGIITAILRAARTVVIVPLQATWSLLLAPPGALLAMLMQVLANAGIVKPRQRRTPAGRKDHGKSKARAVGPKR